MEKSFVFNSINGDRRYKAEDFRDYFASFIGNGVFPNPATNLQVVATDGMNVKVRSGKAWINGAIYYNTDELILSLDHADSVLSRIDSIVLRFDNLERNITCKVKKGIFASNPVAQQLQRDEDAYELCIANILVQNGAISIAQSKITDTRLNSELCGIVTQAVNTIDTTELYRKLEAYIDERGQDVQGWIDKATVEWEREFISWFNTIKDILDGDIAGSLANRILELENVVNNLELVSTSVTRPNGKTVETSLSANETSILENTKKINAIEFEVGKAKETFIASTQTMSKLL